MIYQTVSRLALARVSIFNAITFVFLNVSHGRCGFGLPFCHRKGSLSEISLIDFRVEYSLMDYQAYMVGESGQITQRIDLVCESDEVAKERAATFAATASIELWQNDRKIGEFGP